MKCMFQGCDNEAAITIPCAIGPRKIKEDIHVCNIHFHSMRQQEPFVSVELRKENKT